MKVPKVQLIFKVAEEPKIGEEPQKDENPKDEKTKAWKLQVPVPAMVSALLLVLVTLWAYPTCPSDFGLGAVPGLGCAREVLILKRSR